MGPTIGEVDWVAVVCTRGAKVLIMHAYVGYINTYCYQPVYS